MHLSKILSQSSEKFGSRSCVVSLTARGAANVLSYEAGLQVSKRHEEHIQQLISQYQMMPGHGEVVVAFLSLNSPDYLLALLACMNLHGVLPVLLNTRWTHVEMAAALAPCPSKRSSTMLNVNKTLLLYGRGFQAVAEQVARRSDHTVHAVPLFSFSQDQVLVISNRNCVSTSAPKNSDDLIINTDRNSSHRDDWIDSMTRNETTQNHSGMEDAVIVFTSGTSGNAKGVRLSHISLWVQAIAKLHSPCQYNQDTRMLATTVPVFHVGGLSSVLALIISGGSWVFPPESISKRGFDPRSVLDSLSHSWTAPNTLVVVPTMIQSVLSHVSNGTVFDSVHLILIGGQSASCNTLKAISKVFPKARIVQTYACTEAASSLTFLKHISDEKQCNPRPPSSTIQDTPQGDCVGVPPTHIDLCIFDQNQKEDQLLKKKPRQVGIIATRGFHVMNGYWDRGPQKDVNVLPRNRWFLTNDLGYIDDSGCLFFCGRVKDVIRTGGETVWASEVERIVLQHPDIRECAVFALRDESFGEAVSVAIVTNHAGLQITKLQLREFCSLCGLAGYKRPRHVFIVQELPRNSSGKVLKHLLVERFGKRAELQSKL